MKPRCERYSEEEILLFSDSESMIPKARRDAMGAHILACPDCLERADEYMRMEFPAPDELDEQGELLPSRPLRLAHDVPPLRAAASTAAYVDDQAAAPASRSLCVIGDVEIRESGERPGQLFVTEAGLAGRGLRVIGPEGEPLNVAVDKFQRLRLSADDLACLRRWIQGNAPLQIEVD